ncbi:MAG TPA: NrfD/PsrC family molybdoenzyme membrane anchor subunit [Symbiobacteriaceae bacterium]|nr:NrfD/PsrC family molybdoenzyme membrane anchor subunit [Symbiobacteriaceae bacterium]
MLSLGKWKYTHTKGLMLGLFAVAIAVAVYRLFMGLGASTNLSDNTPWGLWKAFDVIVVVPLGASGFTMAFVRYFLKAEKYEYIMRRSVIWAAIMYLSMGLRLAFDIGLPWRLPYPIVFWGNIHSPLFEVAWCVALYLIVLLVENLPRVTERMGAAWAHKLEHGVHWVAPAFVLGGVLLSSMHQSSLGTLYMIVGKRMDPLWYHPWLNYIYLLTAIAAGLSVTILIEHYTSKSYKTAFHTNLLAKLGVAVAAALAVALVWRVGSLAAEGQLAQIFRPRLATGLWWAEMLVGYVMPIVILANSAWRNSRGPLVLAAAGTVVGMISLRMNVVFTGMAADMGSTYFPSLSEILFTVGATAGTLVIYTIFVEKLPGTLGIEAKAEQPKKKPLAQVAD